MDTLISDMSLELVWADACLVVAPQKFPQLSRGDLKSYKPTVVLCFRDRPGRAGAGHICESNVGVFLQSGWGQKAARPSLGILGPIGGAASEASLLRAAC